MDEIEGSNTNIIIQEPNISIVGSNYEVSGFRYLPSDKDSWKSLVFSTDDEALSFYDLYSKSRGFTIKKAGFVKRHTKNEPIDYPFYLTMQCHKQGFKAEKPTGKVVKRRKTTRTGCKATMKLKMDFKKDRL